MERNYKYVQDGNTVRKIYEFPERNDERRKKQNNEVKPHRRTYRQEEQAPKMSLKVTMFMAVSVILSVMSCINYLDAQADVTETKNNISALEKSIDTLATQNDSIQYEIDSFVDVNYIIKTATEELGMVMVSENQIITYDSTRNEYMEQYGDVPEK